MLLCVHQLAAARHDGVLFWDGAHAVSEKKTHPADDERRPAVQRYFLLKFLVETRATRASLTCIFTINYETKFVVQEGPQVRTLSDASRDNRRTFLHSHPREAAIN